MSSDFDQLDEILGVSFGDTVPDMDSVLAGIHIRTSKHSGGMEGTRGNLLIQTDVLRGLIAGLPGVIEVMREDDADRDLLPPVAFTCPRVECWPAVEP
jgi:hypothetical protein